nr:hypothetical protein GCM10025730_17280 [Promicromonospora thailandica]
MLEDLGRGALLDEHAVGHDQHPVGDAPDHRQVVADEQHPGALVAQLTEQSQHTGLDGLVEGGGGLVGDDEARFARDARRDEGALPLAAGELAGALAGTQLGVVQADAAQQLEGALASGGGAEVGVQGEGVADLAADRAQGVERDECVLRDEAHGAAAQPPQASPGQAEHRLARHGQLGGGDAGAFARQAEDAARADALARAGLTDDRHALARRDLEADAVHHPASAEADRQVTYAKHRLAHDALLFRFWMPRPSTVAAAAAATIASPGKNVIHQKLAM